MRRLEVVGGFFQRFAHHGVDQGLSCFEMAGRLVEGQASLGFLLDQQEFSIALDDGSDGDIGFPDHAWLKRQKRYFTC